MRCEGCDGKFGANGEPEVEVDTEDVSETTLTCDVTVNVSCANCGNEFKTGSLTVEADVEGQTEGCTPECEEDEDRYFEIVNTDAQVADDYRPVTKRTRLKDGTVKERPVPMRYRTHYYDVTVTFDVRCSHCQTEFSVVSTDSLGASELEAA